MTTCTCTVDHHCIDGFAVLQEFMFLLCTSKVLGFKHRAMMTTIWFVDVVVDAVFCHKQQSDSYM